ncbi:hypothetical protein UC8_57390 [Roseimaritima ulvae]|uniref:SHOCT domain-containing protein n=3 Tax=Roseimaritima ulvae TaxID=980254 RepID=A0A5B9QXD6_9BACT|nr:hypothetical protein UC8_57390 [Roseimaritima ulvae]
MHMLVAVNNGNGSMAQFCHPEFGGSGQWMQGGMTMVSDLFNHQLKSLVNNLCSDIASQLANHQTSPFPSSFQSQSQGGGSMGSGQSSSLFEPDPATNWWPQDLGVPNAVGAQNNTRYAYFANSHRLAVTTGGDVWVYDTLDHNIGGFAQQQGSGGSITFTSQYGTVNLSTLPVVSRGGVPVTNEVAPAPPAAMPQSITSAPVPDASSNNNSQSNNPQPEPGTSAAGTAAEADVLDKLERLGALHDKGYVTDDEFAAKKAELLSRL